nr:immunoglobulin light chain junction region [Macaca mulatta]
CQHSYDSPYSF